LFNAWVYDIAVENYPGSQYDLFIELSGLIDLPVDLIFMERSHFIDHIRENWIRVFKYLRTSRSYATSSFYSTNSCMEVVTDHYRTSGGPRKCDSHKSGFRQYFLKILGKGGGKGV